MTNHDNHREMQREARRLAKSNGTSYQAELTKLQRVTTLPPFEWNHQAHLMVTGPAGAGKTVLLKHVAAKALDEGHRVVVVTNWSSEWSDERVEVFTDPESAMMMLMNVFRDRIEGQKTLIVVDTLAYFTTPDGPGQTEMDLAWFTREYIGRIAREGRAYGIRLAISTQRVLVHDRHIAINCEQVVVGQNSKYTLLSVGADKWPGVDSVPAKHGVVFTPNGPLTL